MHGLNVLKSDATNSEFSRKVKFPISTWSFRCMEYRFSLSFPAYLKRLPSSPNHSFFIDTVQVL